MQTIALLLHFSVPFFNLDRYTQYAEVQKVDYSVYIQLKHITRAHISEEEFSKIFAVLEILQCTMNA